MLLTTVNCWVGSKRSNSTARHGGCCTLQVEGKVVFQFLCTRVQELKKDGERKLMKLLSFLWVTGKEKYLFGRGDNHNQLRFYIDCAFACHQGGRSHGGLVVEYVGSTINCGNRKHNICTKESMELEGVSVLDCFQ